MNSWRWFLIALGCFLPLHGAAVAIDEWFWQPPRPTGDGPDYEIIAYNVSVGNGWSNSFQDQDWQKPYRDSRKDYSIQFGRQSPLTPDTNRPPLLPGVIGAVYKIIPRGPFAFATVRIGLAMCLSLGCAFAVYWGYELAQSSRVGDRHLLGWLVAIGTIAIVLSERNVRNYATDFLTELPALLCTQVFLLVAWLGVRKRQWTWGIAAGIAFAAMYYCRSVFILWTPLLVVWFWWIWRMTHSETFTRREVWYWISAWVFATTLLCSIWWIRNCVVLESFSPLGTKGSVTLLGGYCDAAYENGGEWQGAPERQLRQEFEAQWPRLETASDALRLELDLAQESSRRVRQWTGEHFGSLTLLFAKRIVTEWNAYHGKALVLKLMAVVGFIWLARYNRIALVWLVGPLAINTIIVMGTYSVGGRFLVPTYGALYLLAAFGVAGPLAQFLEKTTPTQTVPYQPNSKKEI